MGNEINDHDLEELEAYVQKLSSNNEDLKNQLEKSQSALKAVAAREAALEGEAASLRHDMALARRDLRDSDRRILKLNRRVKFLKVMRKEDDIIFPHLEKGIQDLKKHVEVLMENKKCVRMEQIKFLHKCLNNKEMALRFLEGEKEMNRRYLDDDGPIVNDGGKKGLMGGLFGGHWLLIGCAASALGAVCYVYEARKH